MIFATNVRIETTLEKTFLPVVNAAKNKTPATNSKTPTEAKLPGVLAVAQNEIAKTAKTITMPDKIIAATGNFLFSFLLISMNLLSFLIINIY